MLPLPLMIGGISATTNMLTNFLGSRAASKQLKKQEQMIESERERAENERLANRDYMNTLEARTIANNAAEGLADNMKSLNNNAIKRGYTAEQQIASADRTRDAYSKVMRGLAANGYNSRLYYDKLYNMAMGQYTKQKQAISEARADSSKNAWQNIGDAVSNFGNVASTMVANNTPTKSTSTKNTPKHSDYFGYNYTEPANSKQNVEARGKMFKAYEKLFGGNRTGTFDYANFDPYKI